jgi:hypothetical protein
MTTYAGNGIQKNKHDYYVRKISYLNEKQNSYKKTHVELLHCLETDLKYKTDRRKVDI